MKNTDAIQLPPGVVRTSTPAQAPGRVWDANLVRWHEGQLIPVGGWQRQTSTPMSAKARRILPWLDNSSTQRLGVFTDAKLLVYTADSVFDATPTGYTPPDTLVGAGGYGGDTYGSSTYGTARSGGSGALILSARPSTYSLDTFGENLLAMASGDGKLYQWLPSTPTTIAATVSGAPTGCRAFVVTPERHVMVLAPGGVNRRFAWCSQEDPTDWNYASTTNSAGFLDIDTDGVLVAARVVREGVLLFTDADVWLARYVGQPFIYNVEQIGYANAPICPQAIATFEGRCVWMGRNGFFLYDGGYIKALASEVSDWLYRNLDRDYGPFRCWASSNGSFPEVWFGYPEIGQPESNRYVAWNYNENWWTIGALGRTAMAPAGVYKYPIMGGSDANLYAHEYGFTAAGASRAGTVYAETGNVSLGDRTMSVARIMPDSYRGATATQFRLYGRFTPEGTETAYGPYTVQSDGYCYTRLTAREVRLRIEQTTDADWSIGRMWLTAAPRGKR